MPAGSTPAPMGSQLVIGAEGPAQTASQRERRFFKKHIILVSPRLTQNL
jgi:hypothetical protein